MSAGFEGKYHEEMAELKQRKRSSATLERVNLPKGKKKKPWRLTFSHYMGSFGYYRTREEAEKVAQDALRKRPWASILSEYSIEYVG